ncbi:MAG: PucR family transcriptional regulator ligand-binding domain-containing protein [Lachnospiraceae bacterium]|nr:PucR family transcriptional regulator ligand-binding domain-containing protein [Lachnospiraceae bacterium]
MGFTVEDMLTISRDRYQMKLVAGGRGWANSISWLLMVEDTVIIRRFAGKELVVTTGLGFDTEERLLSLVEMLDNYHAAGLIVNIGPYVQEIPERVLALADECDLPLMTVPWSVQMSEMIKDLTVRIFMQSQMDEQLSRAFIRAIEQPEIQGSYREELSSAFDVDGRFQVTAITAPDLDSMDTRERNRISYRLQIYLEDISHNAHFVYYNGCFLLILNAVEEAQRRAIIDGFLTRAKRRMAEQKVYVGEGSTVTDVSNLHLSYQRAVYAVNYAVAHDEPVRSFDTLGVQRILYAVSDGLILKELREDALAPLRAYDEKHESDLVATLRTYLKNNGSINKTSEEMYIHKNTILYRMNKIRELLGCGLEDGEERAYYYLAAVAGE